MTTYAPTFGKIRAKKWQEEPAKDPGTGGNENNPGPGGGGGWRMDEDRLLQYARRFAASKGYELDDSFASAFLAQLRSRNAEEDDRHSEAEAIEAVKRLVTAAIESTREGNLLTAESFSISLSDLCPLWPFCR